MITLRLFHQTDPFRQLESRVLNDGDLIIGRDPAAHWMIPDPEREVSRQHCVVSLNDHKLSIRDTSANGVYLGQERRRIIRDEPIELDCSETVHFGQYLIVMETDAPPPANDGFDPTGALDAPFHLPMLQEPEANADTFAVLSDWRQTVSGDTGPRNTPANATLLDAFCAGARLDASAFANDDPAELMVRIGAVYQQMVLGLGDLMSERSSVKSDYRMDRTTVAAAGNNPFKWAPTQRVAIDLLRADGGGFLSGPAALKASFTDLKKHLLCLIAGSRAAVAATLDEVSPQAVEADLKGRSLLFMAKSEACWRAFQERHQALGDDARSRPDSPINRAFKSGYELYLRQLDELGTRA